MKPNLPKEKRNRRSSLRWVSYGVFTLCVPLLLLLFAASPPVRQGDEPVAVLVEAGWSTRDVASCLANEGVIRSPLLFRALTKLSGGDGKLKAGEYEFSPGIFPWEALKDLLEGRVVYRPFTVREGLSVEQIGDLVEQEGLGSKGVFLQHAKDPALLPEPFEPPQGQVRYALEGYLFPDTYNVNKGMSEKDLVSMMLNRFLRVFTEEVRAKAEAANLTVHQVATLASIVEKEARSPEERPIIAGVFLNRLKLGMPLQADPTVVYALGKAPGTVLWKDLEVDSPYNTYRHRGLPPGPISNFGLACLQAVLDPEDVDYLYFVAKNDGTGTHAFARTLDEHNKNRRTYQGN